MPESRTWDVPKLTLVADAREVILSIRSLPSTVVDGFDDRVDVCAAVACSAAAAAAAHPDLHNLRTQPAR